MNLRIHHWAQIRNPYRDIELKEHVQTQILHGAPPGFKGYLYFSAVKIFHSNLPKTEPGGEPNKDPINVK